MAGGVEVVVECLGQPFVAAVPFRVQGERMNWLPWLPQLRPQDWDAESIRVVFEILLSLGGTVVMIVLIAMLAAGFLGWRGWIVLFAAPAVMTAVPAVRDACFGH
jgi:hypothetical protein